MPASALAGRAGPWLQLGLITASVVLVLVPPAGGPMLILPLVPATTASTLHWALGDGARLVAPGPYPGSIVVSASRAVLTRSALAHGSLVVTARFTNCGSTRKDLQ